MRVCDNCKRASEAKDGRTDRGFPIGPCYCDRLPRPTAPAESAAPYTCGLCKQRVYHLYAGMGRPSGCAECFYAKPLREAEDALTEARLALVNIRKMAREAVGTREYEDIEEACDAALARRASSPDSGKPTAGKSGADTRT